MQDFHTNPFVLVAIVFGWTAFCAWMGAYKTFFKEPEFAEDSPSEH